MQVPVLLLLRPLWEMCACMIFFFISFVVLFFRCGEGLGGVSIKRGKLSKQTTQGPIRDWMKMTFIKLSTVWGNQLIPGALWYKYSCPLNLFTFCHITAKFIATTLQPGFQWSDFGQRMFMRHKVQSKIRHTINYQTRLHWLMYWSVS